MTRFNNTILLSLALILSLTLHSTNVWAQSLNINQADKAAIVKYLNGIGPKKAQAIINYREQYGDFSKLSQLSQVKGIGAKTIEKNKAIIVFNSSNQTKSGSPSEEISTSAR